MSDNSLPKSWVWSTLKDVGDIASGGTPSTKDESNFNGNIPWITPKDLSGYNQKYITRGKRNITKKGLDSSSAKLLPKDTILFSSRAPIGYTVIASNSISTNQGFKNLIPANQICPDYIYHYLKGNKQLAEMNASGTTFLEISGKRFRQLPIPISPFNEQERIVNKLEELFTQLDAGVESLNKAKLLLKRYRQSVLKSAMEGKLTAEWRKKNKDSLEPASELLKRILKERREKWEAEQLKTFKAKGKLPKNDDWKKKYKEPKSPDTKNLPDLPEGWVWGTLTQLSTKITDGEHISPKTISKGIPLLSAKDIQYHGVLFDNSKYVSKKDAQRFRDRCNPEKDDILIVSRGATIGRLTICNTSQVFCLMGSVILLKPVLTTISKLLWIFLRSPNSSERLFNTSGSTAQQAIYLRDLKDFLLPLPPLNEQKTIVEEIERCFSICKFVENEVDTNSIRSNSLRKSILKDAFSGKLVSQDSSDEPASKLLERIKNK